MQASTISLADGRDSMIIRGQASDLGPEALRERYRSIQNESRLGGGQHQGLRKRLGGGGPGGGLRCQRLGADGFRLPVALKIFSPDRYDTARAYDEAMARVARVALRVAQIQQDNLVDVHNFAEQDGIRLMEMEWIDGYDLHRLLSAPMLRRARERVDEGRWAYLNDVIVTEGAVHPRLKPGIAIAVLRDALTALSALHRDGIVHGDVKPSNIMLKRTGNAKLIDIGSAFDREDAAPKRTFTPTYAAPEVLEGAVGGPQSDLASIGYVLIEMLAGAPLFPGMDDFAELLGAKWAIPGRLSEILPEEVVCNDLLMSLIGGLIAPDPLHRFPSAEAADLVEQGAANFHRQLVRGNLASEYDNEIRVWLEELE